jgi:hypothetical protein
MNDPRTATPALQPARQVCGVVLAASWLALTGCMNDNHLLDDPLWGGGTPIASNASTTNSSRGVSDGTATGALPPSNGPTSPAALVNGAGALGTPPAQSPADAGAGAVVSVGGPRPAASHFTQAAATSTAGQANASAGVVPAGGMVVNANGQESYEQLQQMLRSRGVTWQQLKTGTAHDAWDFICAIPNPHQNNIERHYEGHAVGPFGLAAIRAAIKEIDDDTRGQ